jgi:antitoxin (DNA-binding transcriptional repressor) of toxin-antitoxin stability system
MSAVISIEDAQAHLAELIARLQPGEELVITKDEQPVARLIAQGREARQPRRPGSAKGKLVILADDDEHLWDFKEYLP